eukprot:1143623-Pelagomonas_calceolata.AAC.1
MPEPDAVAVLFEEEMQGLVAEQIGKMNGRASPGAERVNVLVPYIARLFKLFLTRLAILNVGSRPS